MRRIDMLFVGKDAWNATRNCGVDWYSRVVKEVWCSFLVFALSCSFQTLVTIFPSWSIF